MKQEGFLEEFRAATMEYIFQSVSPVVIKEAQRQIGLLFGTVSVPDNLISVHIRWGDKFWEMDLAPIEEYIAAVYEMIRLQDRDNSTITPIYLATEDPRAAK